MLRSFSLTQKLITLVVVMIFIAVSAFIINLSIPRVVDFSWNTEKERALHPFGLDSSDLRIKYGYEIEPQSYYPLYINRLNSCSVLSTFDSTAAVSKNEEDLSSELVINGSGVLPKDVKNSELKFGSTSVPVKFVTSEKDGKFVGVFGRFFVQEKLKLVVKVSCENAADGVQAMNEALDSVRIVERKSRY
jgi:hypothetical protein